MREAVTALILCVVAHVAAAEPVIVLVETRGAPALPALASQVELHADQRASVTSTSVPDADPMTYAKEASRMVAEGRASIVVWTAPVDGGYLVFAAGRWPGRALIELVRVDAGVPPEELERTIALKIAGLLDSLLAPRVSARAVLDVDRTVAPTPAWRLELAAGVARERQERGVDARVTLAVSRTWALGGWRLGPAVLAYGQPSGTIDGELGRVSVTELGAGLGAEAIRPFGAVELFVRPRAIAGVLLAKGASEDGRRGRATVFAPYVGGELGVRFAITETASTAAARRRATSCDVVCAGSSACQNGGVDCGQAATCTVRCEGSSVCQHGSSNDQSIECRASTCDVTCTGSSACQDGIDVDAGGACASHCCESACQDGFDICTNDNTCS